jgi:AdoMet-dependent rRNA methyltransferase SPB1
MTSHFIYQIGSAYTKDAMVQNELVLAALKTATEHLVPRGTFCTKIYRSVDYHSILWVLQQLFADVQPMKPSSSRSQSSEIFLICLGYYAPKSIDPKLFDINHVFKEVTSGGSSNEMKKPDIFHKKYDESYKRQRNGYELESLGLLLTKRVSVTDFIRSVDPIRLLTDSHIIAGMTEECSQFLASDITTTEIKACLEDLRVLNKSDFKKLMKWRQSIRELFVLDTSSKNIDTAEVEVKEMEVEEGDEETKLSQEMKEIHYQLLQKQKRQEKKEAKLKAKVRQRQRYQLDDNAFEVNDDVELFHLPKDLKLTPKNSSSKDDGSVSKEEEADEYDSQLSENEYDIYDSFDDEDDSNGNDNENDKVADNSKLIEYTEYDDVALEDELESEYQRYLNFKRTKKYQAVGEEKFMSEYENLNSRNKNNEVSKSREYNSKQFSKKVLDQKARLEEQLQEETAQVEDEDEDLVDAESVSDNADFSEVPSKVRFQVSQDEKYRNDQHKSSTWFSNPLFTNNIGISSKDVGNKKKNVNVVTATELLLQQQQELIATQTTSKDSKKSKKRKHEEVHDATMSEDRENDENDERFNFMPKTDKEKRKEKRRKMQLRQEKRSLKQQRDLEDEDENGMSEEKKSKNVKVASDVQNSTPNDFEVVPSNHLIYRSHLPNNDDEDSDNDGDKIVGKKKNSKKRKFEDDDGSDNVDNEEEESDSGWPQRHDSRMYDSDHEDYDNYDLLQQKALATLLFTPTHQHQAKDLIDSTYNRYSYNDSTNLPSWFLDDETRHNKPQIPIPQNLLNQIKSNYQMSDKKVIKKEFEAKMRKKKKMMQQLKKAKKQATVLADNQELTQREKIKLLTKTMKNGKGFGDRNSKIYVTTKKTSKGSVGNMVNGGGNKV